LLAKGIPVYVYFNNHYVGYAPGSVACFEKLFYEDTESQHEAAARDQGFFDIRFMTPVQKYFLEPPPRSRNRLYQIDNLTLIGTCFPHWVYLLLRYSGIYGITRNKGASPCQCNTKALKKLDLF
jgi:hypothetical protein